jgi:glycosyltransferase involved in cell wall biosynthesis
MRILQVVKTTNGGAWAAWQAAELVRAGIEVHVVLPDKQGSNYHDWVDAGARLHFADLGFPVRAPWKGPDMFREARKLVELINPEIIHSHFVSTTLTLRYALGRNHPIKRVFQIPGPLHLEHSLYRRAELSSAGKNDFWIPSSRYTQALLTKSGVPRSKQFLSYYGCRLAEHAVTRTNELRRMLGINDNQLIVGNVSWFYRPKYYLAQTVGLKCHEDIIDSLAIVVRKRRDVIGVLVGSGFNGAQSYEERLRTRARMLAGDRIRMPGGLTSSVIQRIWPDFDCAVHVPLSENCGGVVEPLCAGVPTIAANTGGLPELVFEGITGKLVPPRSPVVLADAILETVEDLERCRRMAGNGRRLITSMFDISRTAREVYQIYKYLLNEVDNPPEPFDSRFEAEKIAAGNSANQLASCFAS